MKRLFLILAICLILALAAIWGYLLIFGAPESTREFFANFNFGNTEETEVIETQPIFTIDTPVEGESETQVLRQLTTKPVAGYAEVTVNNSSTTAVYYIEAGTGHIFSLDRETGTEERLSNITVPNAKAGHIAASGRLAVIQSADPGDGELVIVELTGTKDSATSYPLITAAHTFTLTNDEIVLYSLKTEGGTEAFSYNPATKVTERIFTLPFREATIRFGSQVDATHYVYPKTDSRLEGYLYSITRNTLTREPVDGFGLSANGTERLIVFGANSNQTYTTAIYSPIDRTVIESNYTLMPDKCVFSKTLPSMVCATPITPVEADTLLQWYKGTTQTTDGLWIINYANQQIEPIFLVDFMEQSGRNLDAVNLYLPPQENRIYFKNKIDGTLWLFDVS